MTNLACSSVKMVTQADQPVPTLQPAVLKQPQPQQLPANLPAAKATSEAELAKASSSSHHRVATQALCSCNKIPTVLSLFQEQKTSQVRCLQTLPPNSRILSRPRTSDRVPPKSHDAGLPYHWLRELTTPPPWNCQKSNGKFTS